MVIGSQRLALGDVRSFACYYGMGRVAALARHDLVIVQAANYSVGDLRALARDGVAVAAYLSLGEEPTVPRAAPWALRDPRSGALVTNPRWDTTLVDCRSDRWHTEVLQRRIPQTLQQGATGLFLDTVDVQDAHPETRQGVIDLLAAIRHSYPDVVLVVNRGFTILETVLDVAAAVAFESFSSRHDGTGYRRWTGESLAWTARVAAQLNARRGRRPVLALDYAAPADEELRAHTAARARRYGFLSFTGTQALDWLPSLG